MEEQRSAGEQKEQKHNQTGSQAAVQEARKAAVVNLWKACSADGAKSQFKASQTNLELSETQAKLQKAEQTIRDMRKQVSHLQASLISAQSSDKQTSEHSGSIGVDKETNTDAGGAGQEKPLEKRDVRDVAVATEAVGEAAAGSEQPQVSADGLLATLRRMEAMVSGALETAELVKQSEQRVSQVTGRMESIAQRVEEALGRAANTEEQLDLLLECRIAQQEDSQVCLDAHWAIFLLCLLILHVKKNTSTFLPSEVFWNRFDCLFVAKHRAKFSCMSLRKADLKK